MTPEAAEAYLTVECDDRGPRIGGDGTPRCYLPPGHPGAHKADPAKGWKGVSW